MFGAGGNWDSMDVVAVILEQDKEILVAVARRDGELARLVSVDLATDWDACWKYMLGSR